MLGRNGAKFANAGAKLSPCKNKVVLHQWRSASECGNGAKYVDIFSASEVMRMIVLMAKRMGLLACMAG
jgi:hypothetical protein